MLAVTGVTGAIGGRVASLLESGGKPFVMLARRPEQAPRVGVPTRYCSYGDAEPAIHALSGVDTLLMVSGSETPTRVRDHGTFIDAAVEAGVRQVVYTSFVGAAPDAVFTLARDHHATEEHLRASGLAHTILRDNLYLDFLASLPDEDGVIHAPAGQGRVAAVARRDIARVAAHILSDPDAHRGRTYELTGPRAIDFEELATTLTHAQGRDVSYRRETVEEAYAYRRKWPAPQWQYDAWVSTYTAIAAGQMSTVTDDIEKITGTPGLSLEELLAHA
ncbi:NAD(P)-dependent oxidoreductase [Mycolicibacterium sp. (ex Dasyatis americana)]|nr:NAD(P)-dependent oxidoreductase [Mycolicibacterium sp. (ex Dasyatis americana)]